MPRTGAGPGAKASPGAKPDPRRSACAILSRLDREPVDLSAALDRVFSEGNWDSRDRRLATGLTYGVARYRFRLDRIIRNATGRRIKDLDRTARTLLRLGIYQLLYLDRVPARAAVDETVRLAGKDKKKRGFINGVLRRIERGEAFSAEDDPARKLAHEYSLPDWLARRWLTRFGDGGATDRARHGITPAPLTVRVAREGVRAVSQKLEKAGCAVTRSAHVPDALRVAANMPVSALPGFSEGWIYVQDEASQWVGHLVGAKPGERVLDACAAPGGKATQLAAAVGEQGEVVALEVDPARAARIAENADRLGVRNLRVVVADAATVTPAQIRAGGPGREAGGLRAGAGGPESVGPEFDRVLLDAPCSGLGVLGRHPEGKWWKTEDGIAAAAVTQKRLLAHLATLVRPGGSLVYAVCTGEAEETHQVVEPFLAAHPEFAVVPATRILGKSAAPWTGKAGYLDTNGNAVGMDGFFAVHLTRQS